MNYIYKIWNAILIKKKKPEGNLVSQNGKFGIPKIFVTPYRNNNFKPLYSIFRYYKTIKPSGGGGRLSTPPPTHTAF